MKAVEAKNNHFSSYEVQDLSRDILSKNEKFVWELYIVNSYC